MLINTTNIKAMAGISVSTYDARIALLIPQVLSDLQAYCRNDFIMDGNYGYVYDGGTLVFTTTTITHDTDMTFAVGDFIMIYNSEYNNGMYQVKSIDGLELTIETSKTMRAETVTSGYIALIQFPDSFLNIMADYVNGTLVNDKNLKKEEIDDLKLEYFNGYDSRAFINQNSSVLKEFRQLYYKSIPGLKDGV